MAMQDLLSSLKEFDINDLNDVNNVGSWPTAVKAIIWVLAFAAVVGSGYYFLIMPLQDDLARAQAEEVTLREDFESKFAESAHLESYRKQQGEMEQSFQTILLQLPSDTEIPGLIEDITLVGLKNGLDFTSIDLRPEVQYEFYIEKPIKIVVSGSYHELGAFVSDVADLSRIVTLHDFTILPEGGGDVAGSMLKMNILAKTYRYNDQRR